MKLAILENYKNVGKLNGGGAFESGSVHHANFDNIKDLKRLLVSVASNPKQSVCVGTFAKDGEVVPSNKALIGQMTRTKENVNVGSILVVDNDSGYDYDRDIFTKYWKEFHNVSYITTRSGSTLAGRKEHGSHTYYIVKNGIRYLKQAMEVLEAICIIEGLYKVEFYKTGRAVVKTPIDLALSQSSRVVYEDDTEPKVCRSIKDTLDLSNLPKNYEKLLAKADKIRKKQLSKVEKKSLKLHAKYVKQLTGKKIKGGKKAVKKSLKKYGTYTINEKFKLYANNECVGTVGDLITGKLEGREFADLYEPDYDNGSQKAIYYPDTKTFFSQAHGGIKYTVELSDKFNNSLIDEFLKEAPYLKDAHNIDSELLAIIKESNVVDRSRKVKEYARSVGVTPSDVEKEVKRLTTLKKTFDKFLNYWLNGEYHKLINPENRLKNLIEYREASNMVNTGGKVLIVSTYKDDEDNVITNMNSLDTENKLWSDRKTTLLKINEDTGEHLFKEVNTPDLFISGAVDNGTGGENIENIDPCKRFLGMEFSPKKELSVSYNLFHGFPIQPRKYDISRWEKHMTKIYGKKHYKLIMDWFADMYQNPDRKVGYAIVVRGDKGTGKNTFEEALGRKLLSKENYFRTASTDQLFGRFNKALGANLLTVGQEIVWGGNHAHDSVLKDMITEKSRVLEVKGVDAFTINNYSRIYMTSNADWVVPASPDERRFYVASTKKGVHSKKEWSEFHEWLNDERVIEGLMYEMMNRDLSGFNPIYCPDTTELGEQKKEGLYGISRFVSEAVENGYFGRFSGNVYNDDNIWKKGEFLSTQMLYDKYAETNNIKKMSLVKFSQELLKYNIGTNKRTNKMRGYVMNSRKKVAKFFKNKFGIVLHID
jgi:hypothetical protein